MSGDSNLPEPIGQGALAFFQKLLGPVGEASEILSDKIRFYRWKSSIKTLQRAREIAQKRGLDVKEVPLKFLIPFMEQSSLEEENSDLIERWATLLASAANNPSLANVVFVDILSKLGNNEVKLLDEMIEKNFDEKDEIPAHASFSAYLRGAESTIPLVASFLSKYVRDNKISDEIDNIFNALIKKMNVGIIVGAIEISSVDVEKEDRLSKRYHNSTLSRELLSIDILISRGLLYRSSSSRAAGEYWIEVDCIVPTALAYEFVHACRGDRLKKGGTAESGDQ